MLRLGFEPEHLTDLHLEELEKLRVRCTCDLLTMTTLAGCGHPGGSMSTLPALLLLYANANVDADDPMADLRDRIIVSHGHVAPATYATLAAWGFCDREEAVLTLRHFGSLFGGHVEQGVPGVEWNTGNLGQGLSAAVGSALGARLAVADPKLDLRKQQGSAWNTFCLMGDGEQQKGQQSEARRLAVKYGCSNLLGIVDYNQLQIGGAIDDIMPQHIAADFASDGWNVVEVDGHDWREMYGAMRAFVLGQVEDPTRPTVLIAHTTMGYGVDFMEDQARYHGQTLPPAQLHDAIAQLGGEDRYDELAERRAALPIGEINHPFPVVAPPALDLGEPTIYGLDVKTDCRSAYGNVMKELAEKNNRDKIQVAAFSADLEGSVKLNAFHAASPAGFIEGGIQEHNSASASGRLSREGFSVFFSTFGIFGVTETFNQQRLNGFNNANLKLVCTHCGTDVGEDGPTHQVVDDLGLMRSTFDWEIFAPADPNQTDRVIRAIAARPGCQYVGVGRSKLPTLSKADGSGPFYDGTVGFEPGQADVIRDGDDGAIIACGPLVGEACAAHDAIFERTGKRVRVVNLASIRPYDEQAILDAAATGFVLTVEDHIPDTGLGGLVALVIADAGVATRLRRAGIDRWSMSGKPADIFAAYRINAAGIADRFVDLLG
jgi:transketolase